MLIPLACTDVTIENYYTADVEPMEDYMQNYGLV